MAVTDNTNPRQDSTGCPVLRVPDITHNFVALGYVAVIVNLLICGESRRVQYLSLIIMNSQNYKLQNSQQHLCLPLKQ